MAFRNVVIIDCNQNFSLTGAQDIKRTGDLLKASLMCQQTSYSVETLYTLLPGYLQVSQAEGLLLNSYLLELTRQPSHFFPTETSCFAVCAFPLLEVLPPDLAVFFALPQWLI